MSWKGWMTSAVRCNGRALAGVPEGGVGFAAGGEGAVFCRFYGVRSCFEKQPVTCR